MISTIIEIVKPNGKNIIVGCIYRHPCVNPSDFYDVYFHELLQNLGNDSKQIVLMSDFNTDMLKYNRNKDNTTCLDSMYSRFLLPYITAPSRIKCHSRALHISNFYYLTIYFQ